MRRSFSAGKWESLVSEVFCLKLEDYKVSLLFLLLPPPVVSFKVFCPAFTCATSLTCYRSSSDCVSYPLPLPASFTWPLLLRSSSVSTYHITTLNDHKRNINRELTNTKQQRESARVSERESERADNFTVFHMLP